MPRYLYDFNGPDTTEGIPSPSGYPELEVVDGLPWRRLNNRAYPQSPRSHNPILAADVGVGEVDVSVDVSDRGGDAIYFRVLDSDTWFRARVYNWETTFTYPIYKTEYKWRIKYTHANHSNEGSSSLPIESPYIYVWSDSNYFTPSAPNYQSFAHEHYADPTYAHSSTYYRSGSTYTGETRTVWAGNGVTRSENHRVYLEKSVNGVVDILGYTNKRPNSIRVMAKGTSLQLFVNGVTNPDVSVNDDEGVTRSRHGIGRGPSEGSGTALDNLVIDTINSPPNAPILVWPPENAIVDHSNSITYVHKFSDPDPGDSQSLYGFRYRDAGTSTWTETLLYKSSRVQTTFPPNYFTLGKKEWQVATYDSSGKLGPWSESRFLTFGQTPNVPEIIKPSSGEIIATEQARVRWSTDVDQTHYQVVRAGSSDMSGIYEDSGEVPSATTDSYTLSFPVDGRTEYIFVRIKSGGLWSNWAMVAITVDYTDPEQPVLAVEPQSTSGRTVLRIINPEPSTPTTPAVDENWLYRREVLAPGRYTPWKRIETGIPTNSETYDHSQASDVEYEYKINARGANGASLDSFASRSTLSLRGSWFHDPDDPTATLRQFRYNNSGGNEKYLDEVSHAQYAGRSLPVAEYGDTIDNQVSVDITAEIEGGGYDAIRTLLRSKKILCYRDSFGRKVYFASSGYNEKRTHWGATIPLQLINTEYEEAV